MTPMRKKMIHELELHRKSPRTIEAYVTAVAQLAQHYGRSPDRISLEHVREFLHHLIAERKLAFSSCNQKLAGIRFFYRHVLGQKEFDLRVPAKRSGKLPEPLSRREIARLLEAPGNAKHRVLLMTCYATGLRVSELAHLRPAQRKAIRAITACRTAALGGHRQWCERCGYQRYVYHSCRNRHCPQCQSTATAAWVQARADELLPVPYFHNVFTLPHELNALVLYSERNQRALLKLLFDAAAQTLLEFGRQELGGKIGFTLVLHTWDQQLRPHFHVHGLIASGALSADGARWIAGGSRFLFLVRGLSKMFRGKYLDGLANLLGQRQLDLPPQLIELDDPTGCRRWLRQLRRKPWVVYSKPPFAGAGKLLDYLGRYTHRVAISNHRILDCRDGQVRFSYRDRRDAPSAGVST